MSKITQLSVVLVLLVFSLGTTGSFAAINSVGTIPDPGHPAGRSPALPYAGAAQPVIVPAPSTVMPEQYTSNTEIRVFDEQQGVTLPAGGLFVDQTTDALGSSAVIPAGTVVNSHFIHFDNVGTSTGYRGLGNVTFDGTIIGVITQDSKLFASHSLLGAPGTTYPTSGENYGLEQGTGGVGDYPLKDWKLQDIIWIKGDTIVLDLQVFNVLDQLRVITEPVQSNPAMKIDKRTDWTGRATLGDEITYYYDVENTGDVILNNLTVDDDIAGAADPIMSGGYNVGDDNPQDGNFDPGEIWRFEATYLVTEIDLNHCTLDNTATAAAYYEGETYYSYDTLSIDLAKIIILCAGQHEPVGTVTVYNDGTTVHVIYETTDGWLMTETHLDVATSLSDIPQKNGNPIPGHFSRSQQHDPPIDRWEETFNIDDEGWTPCQTDLYIAAHAVVVSFDETCIDFETYSEFDPISVVSTPNGNVNFYMTDYTPLSTLNVGDYAALTPSGDVPVVASPGTNVNPPETYSEIVAFTVGSPPYTGADDIVLVDNGTGAGGNTLTDPQDTAQTELMWHAYSQFRGIVIDVTNLDWVEDMGLVTIDLDHGELWHFLYFDADGILIHKDTIAAGTSSYDGWAFPISWTDDEYSIAKVVIFGEMNNNNSGVVGYAIDNICITSAVQEETAWAGGECDTKPNVHDFPGKNWATYFVYHVMLCDGDEG